MRLEEEKALSKDLRKWFNKLKRRTNKIIEKYYEHELFPFYVNNISLAIEDMKEEYVDILTKHALNQFYRSQETARLLHDIKVERNISNKYQSSLDDFKTYDAPFIQFQETESLFKPHPVIEDNIRKEVFTASQTTLARVDQRITSNLAESYNEGLGIKDAGRKIEKEFSSLKGWEAKRIARTEINSAQNMGAFNSYDELGVEYHQWWSGQDERVRDSHQHLHGKIVRVGNTFSNGLKHPGDRSGPLKEWINCRCTSLPFIMPVGMMAPPGMIEFTEEDLVPIPGYEPMTIGDVIPYTPQTIYDLERESQIINLHKIPPHERNYYLKLKKNHEALVSALDGNYSLLDEMEEINNYFKWSKEDILDKELQDMLNEEINNYKKELNVFEEILNDSGIEVSVESTIVKWDSEEVRGVFVQTNNRLGPFNTDEKFIKYYFKDIDLTIWESVDVTQSRAYQLKEAYKKLPKSLQSSREIVLSAQQPRTLTHKINGYVVEGKGNKIVQFNRGSSSIDTLIHESAHNLEKERGYFISNSKEYVLAFQKDKRRLLGKGKDIEEAYVSDYAYEFTEAALDESREAYKKYGHRPYSEDFAESVKYYLKKPQKFKQDFPEKAKFIEKILSGNPERHISESYPSWLKRELLKYDLNPKQKKRLTELNLKDSRYLSLSEQKELKYYYERQQFSYLHGELAKGNSLTSKSKNEYNRLYSKFKNELDLPKTKLYQLKPKNGRDSLLTRRSTTSNVTQSELDKYALTKEEETLLKELQSKEKLGFLDKHKKRVLLQKKEFNELNNKRLTRTLTHEEEKSFSTLYSNLQKELDLVPYNEFFKKTKPNIFDNIKPHEKTKYEKYLENLKKTEHSIIKDIKYINKTADPQKAVDEIVKRQKLTGYSKELANKWSGASHMPMNDYLKGVNDIDLMGEFKSVSHLKKYVDDLIELIDTMPKNKCLKEDTLLFRGVTDKDIDLSMFVEGKTGKLKTFTSTSYDADTAADTFAMYTDRDGAQGWLLKIHAPKGTKGVAINEDVTWASEEFEYLLSPNQKYVTHKVDKEFKIIEIELIN